MSWLHSVLGRYRASADPLRTQRRIELIAVILAVLLGIQLAYGGVRLAIQGAPVPVEPAADSVRVPAVRTLEVVSAQDRNEIIGRPVFWPGRRPVDPVALREDVQSGQEEVGELREVKLVGVFGTGAEAGIIALVNGKKRRILLGESIAGWKLDSINAIGGQFSNDGRRETLTLQRGTVRVAPVGNSANGRAAPPAAGQQEGANPSSAPAGPANEAPAAEKVVPDTGLSLGAGSVRGE